MNTSVKTQNKILTKSDFDKQFKDWEFVEWKTQKDIYKIEFLNSFIKCAIQKTNDGVHVIYLDSHWETIEEKIKIFCYIQFVIAYKLNNNRGFREIVFNNNGDIIKFEQ